MTPEERMNEARCQSDIQRNHLKSINEFGVSILHVMEGDDPRTPGWSYTIGLWHRYRHPEVIVIGLESGLSQILLNNLNFSIREEERTFLDGAAPTDVLDGYVCFFKTINSEEYGDWFAGDHWFYGGLDFPAVQLLWPNTSGVYPWDNAADKYLRWVQPVLSSLPLRAIN
jgi:hypothetical protein